MTLLNRFALIIVSLGAVFGFLASFFTVAQSLGGGLVGLSFSILIAIIVALAAVIVILIQDRIALSTKTEPQELRPPTVELSINDLVIRRIIYLPSPLSQAPSLIENYLEKQGYHMDQKASTSHYLEFSPNPAVSLEVDDPDQFAKVMRGIARGDKKPIKWFRSYLRIYRKNLRPTFPEEIRIALDSIDPAKTRCKVECRPYIYRQLTMPELFGQIKESVTKEQIQIARHECISLIDQLATGLGGNSELSTDDFT